MSLRDPDRATSTPSSSNGVGGSDNLEATGSYLQPGAAGSAGTASGSQSSTGKRFGFLAPARAAGELGWVAHYRIRSLIGEGGIGLVFLADDTQLSRPVALKVIKPELAGAPVVQSRFVREAQATAAIKHDHIVTIYQVGRHNSILFLAMELLRGMSLQTWLERGRKPSTELVLRIGREIASGLAAAHRTGLVHRDIKPANIWLEAPSGRVKILDFGMARSDRDDVQITQTGTVLGTPAYMAPEQARGETASAGSDLFSLGCVIYRICAGRLPFEGGTIMAVLSALASDIPRSLREIEPEVSPALDELVARLLAKDPSARPASAVAVVASIRAIERELMAERRKVDLLDESRWSEDVAVLQPPVFATASAQRGSRPAPHAGRRAWPIAAVLAASLVTAVATFVIARSRPGARELAARLPIQPATPDGRTIETGAATNGDAALARPRVRQESPILKIAEAGRSGGNSTSPAGRPTARATTGGRQAAVRHDASDQPTEHRSNIPAPALTAATVPKAATANRDDWGMPVDPDGDCKFEFNPSSSEIKIAVPGTPHVLGAEIGRLNAPRLLQSIRGDFDASVRVTGVSHPAGRATVKEYAPYHGAGILLWQDERNYVRLEIAADLRHGKPLSYANFELRRGGGLAASNGLEIKDGSTHLLLERRGNELRAAFGPDGVRWTWFAPLTVELNDSLRIGVAAINSAKKSLSARLEMFAITKLSIAGDNRHEETDKPRRPETRPSP